MDTRETMQTPGTGLRATSDAGAGSSRKHARTRTAEQDTGECETDHADSAGGATVAAALARMDVGVLQIILAKLPLRWRLDTWFYFLILIRLTDVHFVSSKPRGVYLIRFVWTYALNREVGIGPNIAAV